MGSEPGLSTRAWVALICIGAVAAAAAADLMLPLYLGEVSLDDGVDFWDVVFLTIPALVLQGFLAAFLAEIELDRPNWQKGAVVVLAVPLLLAGVWLFHTRAIHADGKEILQLYDRYLHRIPDSKRGEAFIADVQDDHYIICSDLGRADGEDYLCIEADMYRKDGDQVVGGFKSSYIEDGGGDGFPSFPIFDASDCWGDSYECY